jgi:hypothetical protein
MSHKSIPARLDALEQAKPKPQQAWVRVIVPEGLTPDQQEEFIAAERMKLPPGSNLIVRRII